MTSITSAVHPELVVTRQVARHLDGADGVEDVARDALPVRTDGQLAVARLVGGLGAVAVPLVDVRRADDQLVADRIAVANDEADLGPDLDDQVGGQEAAVLDVDDARSPARVRGREGRRVLGAAST